LYAGILELAPGFGRWTKFLLPHCEHYLGIDLSKRCVEACRNVFVNASHAEFRSNDGYSLSEVPDDKYNFVFTFDSLVHAEFEVFVSYIPQIIRKLRPDGIAFLHHSNLAAFGTAFGRPHLRASSVSRENIERLIVDNGGRVIIQEIINWVGTDFCCDCLTTFGRGSGGNPAPSHLHNPRFMDEAENIKRFLSHYCAVGLTNR